MNKILSYKTTYKLLRNSEINTLIEIPFLYVLPDDKFYKFNNVNSEFEEVSKRYVAKGIIKFKKLLILIIFFIIFLIIQFQKKVYHF